MFLGERVGALISRFRKPKDHHVNSGIAAQQLMVWDAILNRGLVSREANQTARDILRSTGDPTYAVKEFFQEK